MSRIGKEPVALPAGVTAKVEGQKVTVKGKLGELAYVMHDGITAKVEDGKVVVERKDDTLKNFHGLARALIHNNVVGVSEGYKKQLVRHPGRPHGHRRERRPADHAHRDQQGGRGRVRRAHPRILSGRTLQGQGHQVPRRAHPP